MTSRIRWFVTLGAALIAALPHTASACASCYGAASGSAIDGMNNALVAMLIILGAVLSAFAAAAYAMYRRWRSVHEASASLDNQLLPLTTSPPIS